MDANDTLARVRQMLPALAHPLRAVRRRALQNVRSKLEMGLVRLSDLPAHDVVAHCLTLAEHEANEPTVESLNTAIALLLAVVETHGAGAAALRSCDGVARLEQLRERLDVPSRAVEDLLAAALRTPGTVPETPPPVARPRFSPVEVVRQEEEEAEEDTEEEVEEVVSDRMRLEQGWRPAAPELCRADERRVLDIERRVDEGLQALGSRRGDAAASAKAAVVLASLRDGAASELPAAVWLERPRVLACLVSVVASPQSPQNDRPARFVEQVRRDALEALASILEKLASYDAPLQCDASSACEPPPLKARTQDERLLADAALDTFKRRHPKRLSHVIVPDDDDETTADPLRRSAKRDSPLSLGGACGACLEAAAPLLAARDERTRHLASRVCVAATPFVVEPVLTKKTGAALSRARVARCLHALDAAAVSSGALVERLAASLLAGLARRGAHVGPPANLRRRARLRVVDASKRGDALRPALAVLGFVGKDELRAADRAHASALDGAAPLLSALLRGDAWQGDGAQLAAQCRASLVVVESLTNERPGQVETATQNMALTPEARMRATHALQADPDATPSRGSIAEDCAACCVYAWARLPDAQLTSVVLALLQRLNTRRAATEALLAETAPAAIAPPDASVWAPEALARPDPGRAAYRLAASSSPWRAQVLRQRLLSHDAQGIRRWLCRAGAFDQDDRCRHAARQLVRDAAALQPRGAFSTEDAPYLEAQGLRGLCDSTPIGSLARALFAREAEPRRQAAADLSVMLETDARAPDELVEVEVSSRDTMIGRPRQRSASGHQIDLLSKAYARCAASSDFLPSEVAARELRDALLTYEGPLDASSDLAAAAAACAGCLGDAPFGARARAASRVLLALCWRLPQLHEASLLDLVLRAAFVAPDNRDAVWDDQGARACLFACASAIAFSDLQAHDGCERPLDAPLGEVFAPIGRASGARIAWALVGDDDSTETTPAGAAGAAAARSALASLAKGGTRGEDVSVDQLLAKCAAATSRRAYDEAVHGLLAALVSDPHRTTKQIIERDWARAFERPLSVQPRGRKERRSLKATLGVLDAVAAALDPLDARWRDLSKAACEVVAPAGLVGESDGLPAQTCTFLHTLCRKAPRFALSSDDAERLLMRLLDKGPLSGSAPARDRVAAVVTATALLQRLDATESIVRRRLCEAFVLLCAPTSCSPPDSFFGRNALVAALRGLRVLGKQARGISHSSSAPPAYFDQSTLCSTEGHLVWLSRLLCDRGAECRAAAYLLAADCASFDFGYDALVREGDPLDASHLAGRCAADATEAASVRGAACSLLAALVTPSKRDSHAANAAARALAALSEDAKRDPAHCVGACHLALALTVAPAPSTAPRSAGYVPLQEAVQRHCGVLAAIGGTTRKQACVEATKASARIGDIVIDAQHLATLGLAPQTIATADLGTWRHALSGGVPSGDGLPSLAAQRIVSGALRSHDAAAARAWRALRALVTQHRGRDVVLNADSVAKAVQCLAGAAVRIAAGEWSANAAFAEAAECLSVLITGDAQAQGDALRASDALGVDGKAPLAVAAACATIIASDAPGCTIAAAARCAHAVVAAQRWRRALDEPRLDALGAALMRRDAQRVAAQPFEGPDENADASEADAACGAAFAAVLDASPACRKRARTDGCSIERRLVALSTAADGCSGAGHSESHPAATVDHKACRTVAAYARVVAASLRRGARDDADFDQMDLASVASTLRKAWPRVKAACQTEDESGGPGADAFDALNRCALALAAAGDGGCVAVAAGSIRGGCSNTSVPSKRRAAGDASLARCLMDSAVRGELAVAPAAARDADATALVVASRCELACAALAKLSQAPCRGAVLQGGFVKDCVVALRRLAAAAHVSASRASYEVRSSRNRRAEALLGTLVSATMYPDAQRALLDEPQTAELLLDLCHYYGTPKSVQKYSSPGGVDYTPSTEPLYPGARARTASLLRNLALLRRNKGRILAQPPLVAFLLDALQAPPAVVSASATALWALVHHSEKARALLRADGLPSPRKVVHAAARAIDDAAAFSRGGGDDAHHLRAAQRALAHLRAILADDR